MLLVRQWLRLGARTLLQTALPTFVFCLVLTYILNINQLTPDAPIVQEYNKAAIPTQAVDLSQPNDSIDLEHDNAVNVAPTAPTHSLVLNVLQRQQTPLMTADDYIITGKLRTNPVYVTIGIPTIYRTKAGTSYIKGTIASLVENVREEDYDRLLILVFLADWNSSKRREIREYIIKEYGKHIDSGLIILLEVDPRLYPPLTNLKSNFKDEPRRVSWRSKQVLDFAFMFYFARNLSQYYVQIEDDVIAAKDYVPKMRSFISSQKNPWVTLQLSELGFIGKVYAVENLELLARFFIMFYQEMPVDWMYVHFAKLLTHPEMPLLKPTLFQHMGEYSSLILSDKQKLNKLKDKFFDGPKGDNPIGVYPKPHSIGNNPPASIYTSIEPYRNNRPMNAYSGSAGQYFWGKRPVVNDTYLVAFHSPEKIKTIVVETGHSFQRNDYLRSGVLEVAPNVLTSAQGTQMPVCGPWTTLSVFSQGRVEVDKVSQNVTWPICCMRIRVTREQEEWIIIHQIIIWTEYSAQSQLQKAMHNVHRLAEMLGVKNMTANG